MSHLKRAVFLLVVLLAMANCTKAELPVMDVSGSTPLPASATPAVVSIDQITVTPLNTPTPEIPDKIMFPFGYGLEFDDPSRMVGTYIPVLKSGTGVITGKVILTDVPADAPVLVYKPAHLQSNPKLPSQFVAWIESFYGLDSDPCDSTHVRTDDASGWVIASSGEQWTLESEAAADSEGFNINFAPDICLVVPGHGVFKFENVDVTGGQDVELPTLNLPQHPVESAGWVVYPVHE